MSRLRCYSRHRVVDCEAHRKEYGRQALRQHIIPGVYPHGRGAIQEPEDHAVDVEGF